MAAIWHDFVVVANVVSAVVDVVVEEVPGVYVAGVVVVIKVG